MKEGKITALEINLITGKSKIREKAFFTVIRQSGLDAKTIRKLRIKHIPEITLNDTPIPCKIIIPNSIEKSIFEGHYSFLAEEAVKYLKKYLSQRELKDKERLTPDSLLFSIHNKPDRPISIKEMNRTLKKTSKKVLKGGKKDFQLTDFRQFFKDKAAEMGQKHVNYLMGTLTKNLSNDYTPENGDFYRRLYNDLAKDALNIEQFPLLHIREVEIKDLRKQRAKSNEFIGNILSLIHESDGAPDDTEIGDNLLGLWQKASDIQSNTLLDRWNNNSKYPPYVDIPLTLTNIFQHIIDQYENKQPTADRLGE